MCARARVKWLRRFVFLWSREVSGSQRRGKYAIGALPAHSAVTHRRPRPAPAVASVEVGGRVGIQLIGPTTLLLAAEKLELFWKPLDSKEKPKEREPQPQNGTQTAPQLKGNLPAKATDERT